MSAERPWSGAKWIRREKRIAIYMRDGWACVWCSAKFEDGAELTLDHVRPVVHQGTNDASNLITCCRQCNCSRGGRPSAGWPLTRTERATVERVRHRALRLEDAEAFLRQAILDRLEARLGALGAAQA